MSFVRRMFAKVAIFVSSFDKHALPNLLSAAKCLSPSSISIYHSTSTTHAPQSLVDIQKKQGYTHWVTVHSSVGKTLFPQFAARMGDGFAAVSDVIRIEDERVFKRPIYAGDSTIITFIASLGNAVETVQVSKGIPVALTIRLTAFAPLQENEISTESSSIDTTERKVKFVSLEGSSSSRPDLASAKIVVSGGRALRTRQQFDDMLNGLADALGPSITAIGASRAAVDSNLASNDLQVGQTGRVVAPHLYIAIGISGAIQHVAGMKDSKCVVAINKDRDAPIINLADYSLIGDLFDIVPELIKEIKSAKQE
jgi:electron transfer flavoprotein alpha subunit